jgi:hypothetical protein
MRPRERVTRIIALGLTDVSQTRFIKARSFRRKRCTERVRRTALYTIVTIRLFHLSISFVQHLPVSRTVGRFA